jgi:hypothetical protein
VPVHECARACFLCQEGVCKWGCSALTPRAQRLVRFSSLVSVYVSSCLLRSSVAPKYLTVVSSHLALPCFISSQLVFLLSHVHSRLSSLFSLSFCYSLSLSVSLSLALFVALALFLLVSLSLFLSLSLSSPLLSSPLSCSRGRSQEAITFVACLPVSVQQQQQQQACESGVHGESLFLSLILYAPLLCLAFFFLLVCFCSSSAAAATVFHSGSQCVPFCLF